MIGSFASEGGRPAIFLPEHVEVLAHGVYWTILFSRSLQILALPRPLERRFFILWIVAEVLLGRKSIGGYFWPREQFTRFESPWPSLPPRVFA